MRYAAAILVGMLTMWAIVTWLSRNPQPPQKDAMTDEYRRETERMLAK